MKRLFVVLLMMVGVCSQAWAGNTHGVAGTEEWKFYNGDAFSGYVVSGCLPGTSGTTTTGTFACNAYMRGSDGALVYVTQVTKAVGPLSGGDGTYWVAVHRDVSTAVSGWTRQAGTHYLWQKNTGIPSTPSGGLLLAHLTVQSGQIPAATISPVAQTNPAIPVQLAHTFPGSTAGEQIHNAILKCPRYQCMVDARGLPSVQTWTTNLWDGITWPGTLLLHGGTITASTQTLPLNQPWTIQGAGIDVTTFLPEAANQVLWQFDASGYGNNGHILRDFTLKAHASGSTGGAILISNCRLCTFQRLAYASNGGNYAALFLHNTTDACYGNRFEGIVVQAQTGPTAVWSLQNGGSITSNCNANVIARPWILSNTGITTIIDGRRTQNLHIMDGVLESNTGATAITVGTAMQIENTWFESNAHNFDFTYGADGNASNVLITNNSFVTADTITIPATAYNVFLLNNAYATDPPAITNNSPTSLRINGTYATTWRVGTLLAYPSPSTPTTEVKLTNDHDPDLGNVDQLTFELSDSANGIMPIARILAGKTTSAGDDNGELQFWTASGGTDTLAKKVTITRYGAVQLYARTLAQLATIAGSVADGQQFYCSDCDPTTSPCTSAGAKTGALAMRLNGAYRCF